MHHSAEARVYAHNMQLGALGHSSDSCMSPSECYKNAIMLSEATPIIDAKESHMHMCKYVPLAMDFMLHAAKARGFTCIILWDTSSGWLDSPYPRYSHSDNSRI